MATEFDKFDQTYHDQVLFEFENRLVECGFEFDSSIQRVKLEPSCIAYFYDITDISKKGDRSLHIGQHIRLSVIINYTDIKIYLHDGSNFVVNVGNPTKKGYRSKINDLEDFIVDQNLNLTSDSIKKMKKFVHNFKIWAEYLESDFEDSDWQSHEKYNGAYGYDDDTIDEAFEGDPENYWNID